VPYAPPSAPAAPTPKQEVELLKRQAEELSTTLGEIQKRIDELESQA
jgi:hypothetical protein